MCNVYIHKLFAYTMYVSLITESVFIYFHTSWKQSTNNFVWRNNQQTKLFNEVEYNINISCIKWKRNHSKIINFPLFLSVWSHLRRCHHWEYAGLHSFRWLPRRLLRHRSDIWYVRPTHGRSGVSYWRRSYGSWYEFFQKLRLDSYAKVLQWMLYTRMFFFSILPMLLERFKS